MRCGGKGKGGREEAGGGMKWDNHTEIIDYTSMVKNEGEGEKKRGEGEIEERESFLCNTYTTFLAIQHSQ